MIRRTVHRASLSGRPVCGAAGSVSTSGAAVTCRFCLEAEKPAERVEVVSQIEAAAARFRREDR